MRSVGGAATWSIDGDFGLCSRCYASYREVMGGKSNGWYEYSGIR